MWWRKRREQDLDRELRDHLELEAGEREDHYNARRALGNTALIKEGVRESWGLSWFDRQWQDLRYAVRVLRRSPGFTVVAILSLALGIGANTVLFSALDAVLWKSLPVRDARKLRILAWVNSDKAPIHSHSGYNIRDPKTGQRISGSFSYPGYLRLKEAVPQFSDLTGFAESQFTVAARGTSEYAMGQFVSGNYFTGLSVSPYAGRVLHPEDDGPGRPPVVVLTYRYWDKRFGLDPTIIGHEVVINSHAATVIGVTPPMFQGLQPGLAIDLFVPFSMTPDVAPRYYSLTDPYNWWVQVFGRLQPGVSDAVAVSAVQAALAHVVEDYAGTGSNAETPRVLVRAGAEGVQLFADQIQQPLFVLAAVVAAVLLIACVNLANLLLARSEARRREIAVRLSIGAGRARLIRQLLTESLL
jgi:predicted permease